MFRQAPELSGEALNAFGSVVVQPDTVHPSPYVGIVPGSPCISNGQETHAPGIFLPYPGRHMFRQTPEVSGEAPDALISEVLHVAGIHPKTYVFGIVPESPIVTEQGSHAPTEFNVYPGLHVFLHIPKLSGFTLTVFGSVVVQLDTVHPEEYALGYVPESPVVTEQEIHSPEEILLYPGRHVFLQTPELSGEALNAFRSVVVQLDTVHPEEYAVGDVPGSPGFVTTHDKQLLLSSCL